MKNQHVPTAQKITVLTAGSAYRPSCNRCGWSQVKIEPSLGAARDVARAHAAEKGCV